MDALVLILLMAFAAVWSVHLMAGSLRDLRCEYILRRGTEVDGVVTGYKVRSASQSPRKGSSRVYRSYHPRVEFRWEDEVKTLATRNGVGLHSYPVGSEIVLLYAERYPKDALVKGEEIPSPGLCYVVVLGSGLVLLVSLLLIGYGVSLL